MIFVCKHVVEKLSDIVKSKFKMTSMKAMRGRGLRAHHRLLDAVDLVGSVDTLV